MEELRGIVEKYEGRESSLIEILMEIQKAKGYLPREDLFQLSEILKVPVSSILRLATFYKVFRLSQKPKREIKVCVGTPCLVRGGKELIERLEKILGVTLGEESQSTEICLTPMECKGRCALGPQVEIDGELISGSDINKLEEQIKKNFGKG